MKDRRRQEPQKDLSEDMTYDKAAKEVLALRQILAPILKRLVPEFQSLSFDTIAQDCIEGTPWAGTVPVAPGRTNRSFRATSQVHHQHRSTA